MLRLSHYLTFAAVAVAWLAQSALAQAHSVRSHHAAYRHHYYAARFAYGHRDVNTILNDVATSPFYGQFGGYEDTYAASHYFGPNQRHYFGYGFVQPYWYGVDRRSELDGMVEQEASANGVPASLVHRVIMRESGYNPRAASRGNYGLMQIRLGTARAMGYGGSVAGLLDPQTNMTYAVRYLAGAYRAAGGNESRAVALYARGYNAPRFQEASYRAPAGSFAALSSAEAGQRYAYY
jgi:Transglycosylase SLT domain